MNSNEVFQKLTSITREITNLLRSTQGSDSYNEVDHFIDWQDTAEDQLLHDEICSILEKLESVKNDIDYLNKPVKKTGILNKNSRERFESDFMEYTSGTGIEALINDPDDGKEKWVISRVEYNDDYYIVGYPKIKMDGLQVRIRQ